MINYKNVKKYCSGDYTKIENYEKAVSDTTQMWHCHHRLETHTSDGLIRQETLTSEELIALNTYYDRPEEELIFLTKKEHRTLHAKNMNSATRKKLSENHVVTEKMKAAWEQRKGIEFSEEHKKNISIACIGRKPWNDGKSWNDETKKKISETKKGRKQSLEEKQKQIAAQIGKHWFTNGTENKFCYECPEGFRPGRTYRRKNV